MEGGQDEKEEERKRGVMTFMKVCWSAGWTPSAPKAWHCRWEREEEEEEEEEERMGEERKDFSSSCHPCSESNCLLGHTAETSIEHLNKYY